MMLTNPPIDRSVWSLRRSSEWLHMAETTFKDRQWYENFHVSREAFQYIVSEVEHEIRRQDIKFRKAVCPSTKVAILLYYVGSTAECRTTANLFGISKSFVSLCIKEVALAIIRKLKTSFLLVPKGEDLKEVMKIYRKKWGFPACAGAIDGTHVPIQAPLENPTDSVNQKSFHSVVMQAYVDARYLFRDVVVGWPGSVHDARVLSNTDLYYRGQQGSLFNDNITVTLLGREMKPVILGDSAYPLLRWLMKGYPENQHLQRHFNFHLSRA